MFPEAFLTDAISRARLTAGMKIDEYVEKLGADGPKRKQVLESGMDLCAALLEAFRLEQADFAGFKREVDGVKSDDIESSAKYPDRTSKEILKGFLDEVVDILGQSLGNGKGAVMAR
ncbi:MAG: hypothetical protein IT567_03800 [Alphaproteobacteria bacterium]|nr:hypothetical protein [Alphaproteobacteria bacterium]